MVRRGAASGLVAVAAPGPKEFLRPRRLANDQGLPRFLLRPPHLPPAEAGPRMVLSRDESEYQTMVGH